MTVMEKGRRTKQFPESVSSRVFALEHLFYDYDYYAHNNMTGCYYFIDCNYYALYYLFSNFSDLFPPTDFGSDILMQGLQHPSHLIKASCLQERNRAIVWQLLKGFSLSFLVFFFFTLFMSINGTHINQTVFYLFKD